MIKKIKNKLMLWVLSILQPIVEEWLAKAWEDSRELYAQMIAQALKESKDVGYEIGSEDATRRCHELYMFGRIDGYTRGMDDAGAISIEEVDEELSQTVFEGVE